MVVEWVLCWSTHVHVEHGIVALVRVVDDQFIQGSGGFFGPMLQLCIAGDIGGEGEAYCCRHGLVGESHGSNSIGVDRQGCREIGRTREQTGKTK